MKWNIWGELTIKMKLIVLFLLFLCLPFFGFGTVWYYQSTHTIEQNAIENNIQIMNQIGHSLDTYLTDLRLSTLPLLTHPLIQDFLEVEAGENFNIYLLNRQFRDELFPTFVYGRTDIAGIHIVSFAGNMISSSTSFQERGIDARIESYLRESEQRPPFDNYRIVGISRLESVPLLTITRKIVDTDTYIPKGLMVIDLKLNTIFDVFRQATPAGDGYFWMRSQEGQVIYHPEQHVIGTYVDAADFLETAPFQVEKDNDRGQLSIHKRTEFTGWTITSELPLDELNEELIRLRNMTVTIALSLIVVALFAVGSFAFSLTKSLSRLQRLMRRAEMGDLNVQASNKEKGEIGALNRGFNKMVSELRRLIEVVHTSQLREKELEIKQRESTLHAMQSQINPHFLYNTLEVINSNAIVEGHMTISKMATGLADLFRYSVGNPEQTVSLEREWEHSCVYLDIQKERYPYLEIETEWDETPLDQVKAIKLTLQPLLENVFKHGYERHKRRPDYVSIRGKEEGEYYGLRIADKGCGMSEHIRNHYNAAFQNEELPPYYDEERQRRSWRIGMWNVHYRLRLTFGMPYGLYIESSNQDGTIIMVKLPVER